MKRKLLFIVAVLLLAAGAGASNMAGAAPLSAAMVRHAAAPGVALLTRRAGLAGWFPALVGAANAVGLRHLAGVGEGLDREQGQGEGHAAGSSAFQVRV